MREGGREGGKGEGEGRGRASTTHVELHTTCSTISVDRSWLQTVS